MDVPHTDGRERGVKSLDLAEQASISYRQLDFWVRKGYIKERSPGGGSGFLRDFTDDEVAITVKMARLIKIGFKPGPAAEYARLMVEQHTGSIIVDGWLLIEELDELAPGEENVNDVTNNLVEPGELLVD